VARLTGRIKQDRVKVITNGGEMAIEMREDLHNKYDRPGRFCLSKKRSILPQSEILLRKSWRASGPLPVGNYAQYVGFHSGDKLEIS
jgi:hypothetical protein